MIQKFIYRMLKRRHFWRQVGFDELSELYTSTMLRNVGLSLVGIFVPIYLYDLGYSISAILLFFAILFLGRAVGDVTAGYVVALRGPKHTMLYSNIVQVIALILLLTLSQVGWPLWLIAFTWGMGLSLYFIAYHVDFSKIMHSSHSGRELGSMAIVERVGGVGGPLIGGVIATIYGAQYTILIAIVLLLIATTPLFLSPEPTKTHQKLQFRYLAYKKLWRDFISWGGAGIEMNVTHIIWPLFIAVTIITTNTYAGIGLITSLSTVVAIIAARVIGKIVDRRQGGMLLKWSAMFSSFLHLLRPFVGGVGGVVAINSAGEVASSGFRLPYHKGMYDRADHLPGYRIAYLVVIEAVGNTMKTAVWIGLWAVSFFASAIVTLQISFVIASLAALLVLLQRFPALKTKQ